MLSDLVARRAEDNRDDPFLFFEDRIISFGEADAASNRLANGLLGAGIGAGDRVGVMLPSHPDHVFTFLALAKLGATHVPINTQYKANTIEHLLADAGIGALVADIRFAGELEAVLTRQRAAGRIAHPGRSGKKKREFMTVWRGGVITVTAAAPFEDLLATGERVRPRFAGDPLHVAMVLYTSGTTGPSKGVMVTDTMYQTAAKNAGVAAETRPGDVMFLWEPLHHVAGVQTVILSLQQAIPCAMVERFSASQFWNQVRRHHATQVHYLGGVLGLLLKQPERPDDGDNPVRIAYGAPAPPDLWVRFEKRFGVKIHECYGMTEASSFTTINLDGKVGSIGKPVPEFDVRIVDDADLPVPAGTIGEIVQREKVPGVIMRGYLNNAESTRIALRGGWLHTGDLGYCDEEGFFYFSGRKKDTIRTRGENVSAWVVEQAVIGFPGVEECAAVGVPSGHGEEDIKLFVRPGPDGPPDPVALVRYCEERLARFEVPRYIAFIDVFPKTPSERIRKGELSRDTDCWDREEGKREEGREKRMDVRRETGSSNQ